MPVLKFRSRFLKVYFQTKKIFSNNKFNIWFENPLLRHIWQNNTLHQNNINSIILYLKHNNILITSCEYDQLMINPLCNLPSVKMWFFCQTKITLINFSFGFYSTKKPLTLSKPQENQGKNNTSGRFHNNF